MLRALRIRSLTDDPGAFGQTMGEALARTDAEWDEMAAAAADGDARAWFLAFDRDRSDSRPAGMVTGRRRAGGTLLVFSMWVAPGHRRSGLGSRLLEAAEGWGRGWKAHRTLLWVMDGNDRALAFYEALGFRRETGTDDDAAGRRVGAAALTRPIGPDPGRSCGRRRAGTN